MEEALIGLSVGIGITVFMIAFIKLCVYLTVERPEKKQKTVNEFRDLLTQIQRDVETIKKQTNQIDDRIKSLERGK